MNENDEKKIRDTVKLYDGFSEKYDRKYSAYLHHTHRRLMNQMGDISGERILDISCGTGLLAEQLLSRYSGIDLLLNDPSDGMRSIAEARFKGNTSVEFSDQPAEDFTYKPNSFDRVICLNSLHYYTDQTKAIQIMYDVLKPDGLVNVLDWNLEGWFYLPNLIISSLSPENINTRSLPEMKTILQDNGFDVQYEKRWSYRFWKLYLIEAKK